MKPKAAKRGAARLLRRGVAGILALAGVGMAAVAAGLPPLPEQAAAYLLEQQTQADAPGGQALSFWQRILLADSALLAQADRFLLMPDLMAYFLTGEKVQNLEKAVDCPGGDGEGTRPSYHTGTD